jgi:uncharacterized membrane-anchored protein
MASDTPTPVSPTWNRLQWLTRGLDWLSGRERYVLTAGVAIQVLFLVAMMVRPLITLSTGDTILLRVAPVDPRDLFRGDYVTLSYTISRPNVKPGDAWQSNWERMRQMEGKTIYVLLEPEADGKHWQSSGYQFDPPSAGKFIRGTVEGNGLVRFGIEQYFVQEGQGHDYENAVRERKLSAEVALDKNGSAQLRRLIIE